MPEAHQPNAAPIESWRLWLGRILLIPLVAFSGSFVYALGLVLLRGELTPVSRGWKQTSGKAIQFAEDPFLFSLFFLLMVMLAGLIIFATFLVAKKVIRRA
jgi:hypothetical protein